MKVRLAVDGGAQLLARDGTVVGHLESITVSMDTAAFRAISDIPRGTIGGAVAVDVSSTTDVEQQETSVAQPHSPSQASFLPDPIDETWQVYLQASGRSKAVLTPKVRRWITNAHAAVGADETRKAIRGLAASDYHREHGYVGIEHAIRPKQNETIEGRIAFMAAKALQGPGPYDTLTVEQLVASFDEGMRPEVWSWLGGINEMLLSPGSDTLRNRGEYELKRFRDQGYEIITEEGDTAIGCRQRIIGARAIA